MSVVQLVRTEKARVNPSTACFVAIYVGMLGIVEMPITDDMLAMMPP